MVDHPEGLKVSKFVTVVVKPKGDGSETGLDCYMVSDQCQALERDNIFGNSDSRKFMKLREPTENEMIPSVVKEGKTVHEFEPDFFIVTLAHGQPKKGKDYNYLKNFDFPPHGRDHEIKRQDFKNYVKRHKSDPPARRYANFHLLLYLAELMDVDTAMTIAHHVADEQACDPALLELLESM